MTTRTWRIILWGGILLAAAAWSVAGWVLFTYVFHRPPVHALFVRPSFPAGIVIHHTATPPVVNGRRVDAAFIDRMHALRGFRVVDRDGHVYHIGYHFLILQDGEVQRGRPETLPGGHTRGHSEMLGIVLVGNFHRASNRGHCGPLTPPAAQLAAAERLTLALMARYHLTPAEVYLHRDLCPTACPGDQFPEQAFRRAITPPTTPPTPAPNKQGWGWW